MFNFYNIPLEDTICHKLPEWSINDPYSYRSWYHEDIQQKDTLLITVGDSWTWGDHLGKIDWDRYTNDPIRLTQIYGRKLANLLDADWVNLAEPGCSNYWMIEKLQDIKSSIENSSYKRVNVVITLTEDLREATYTKRFNVIDDYNLFFKESNTLTEFLLKVENFLYKNLNEYFATLPRVNFYVSRAFTDSQVSNNILLEKSWCDVLQENVKFSNYQRPVPFIGQMSIDPLREKFINLATAEKKYKMINEFMSIMDRVTSRWEFLGVSEYNLKGSTYHPNPAGHTAWAEYLCARMR
jgi:hypothetical protein